MDARSLPTLGDWVAGKADARRRKIESEAELDGLVHIVWLLSRHYAILGMVWSKFSEHWKVPTFPKKHRVKIKREFDKFYDSSKTCEGDPVVPDELSGLIGNLQAKLAESKLIFGRVAELEIIIDAYVEAGAKERMWPAIVNEYNLDELPLKDKEALETRFNRKIETRYQR